MHDASLASEAIGIYAVKDGRISVSPSFSEGKRVADILETSWRRCWRSLKAHGDGAEVMQQLVAAYGEPHRKYHAIQHLVECLEALEHNLDLAREPAEVEMGLWFHDAIYDVKASDNEERSARWAELELQRARVVPTRIHRVKGHILATRHAALPKTEDEMLMVDIDLAILGAPRARFDEYELQVRAEYGWVPDFLFRRKRRRILEQFLGRVPIYSTRRLHNALEDRARANLAHSIGQLNS